MNKYEEFFPSKEDILEYEPEDLAPALLRYLNYLENNRHGLHRRNFIGSVRDSNVFTDQRRDELMRLFNEAWVWLDAEGFLAPKLDDDNGWMYITKRGKRTLKEDSFLQFSNGRL